MSIIARNSIMSASSTSSSTQTQRSENRHPQFEVWSLIRRRSNENPFCMEAKFRAGKRLHRIRNTIVTRRRKHVDSEIEADDEASATSSTDSSDDWLNSDDEEDDFFDIFERLNHVNNKKRDLKSIATMLISQRKQQQVKQSVPNQRPASGDMFVLEELTFTGSNAQKLYLKKCADFQITPCSHFVKSLSSKEIDMEHHNVGPKGAVACAFALTKASTIRTVNMNDIGMGPRGAKYIALMLRENQRITDLNISDNCIGVKGAKYLTDVIIDVDKLYRLDLSGNDFLERDAEVIKLLMEEARNLKYLNLSHNEFRESGGELIGEALNWNDGLEELDLSWNHLRRRGSIGIAEGLQDNSSLRILNLSWNGFYLEGCRALVRTLQLNTTLEVLDLSNNRINRECLGHLVKGLAKNTTLHTLILRFNPLTSDGAYDILKFIHDCPTSGIQTLDLGVQQVDPDFITLYKEVLIQKRTLDVIYGQVVGHSLLNYDEIERKILDENPSIVLLEFGKLMGFRLLDLFSTLDKDGSRTLDRDEIERGLRMANIPMSDHCLDLLIQKLDTNGDGEIDFAELMQAKQEYRKLHAKLLQAQEGQGDTKLEETPLWRIKSMLLKLMAEKVVDYPSFQSSTQMLVKQIRTKTEEKDAREETQAKIRASQPRKVKSRPTSSVRPSPIDIHVLSASSPEHSDDDVILTPELTTGNNAEEKAVQSVRKSNFMRRNFSVQLPLTDLERILNRQNLNENMTPDFEGKEEILGADATSDNRNNDDSNVGHTSKAVSAQDSILDMILQTKEKKKSQRQKGKNAMRTNAGIKEFSPGKFTPRKTFSKEQHKLKERVIKNPPDGRARIDKGQGQSKKETKSPERQESQLQKRTAETETKFRSSVTHSKDKLKIPVDASTLNPKATMYPEKGTSELSQHTKSGI